MAAQTPATAGLQAVVLELTDFEPQQDLWSLLNHRSPKRARRRHSPTFLSWFPPMMRLCTSFCIVLLACNSEWKSAAHACQSVNAQASCDELLNFTRHDFAVGQRQSELFNCQNRLLWPTRCLARGRSVRARRSVQSAHDNRQWNEQGGDGHADH